MQVFSSPTQSSQVAAQDNEIKMPQVILKNDR